MILEDKLKRHVDDLISRYPKLKEIEQQIIDAYLVLEECYSHNGKLLIAGNGGSAADAEHIAGELMKRFKTPRPIDSKLAGKLIEIDPVRGKELAKNLECSLMAIPLVAHEALTTAYINDVDGLGVFAQQLFGFGREGDVFLGISTSGNSKNIMSATVVARALGIKVIGLTGNDGGELASVADVAVIVPDNETYRIQEYHLPIYHISRKIRENGKDFPDSAHIIYVDSKNQEDTELGRLMHDFHCKSPEEMYHSVLQKQVFQLKKTREGVNFMCREMDKIYRDGEKIGRECGEKIGQERGEKIGQERGEKIGKKQGIRNEQRRIVNSLKRKGKTMDEIAYLTGIHETVVKKLLGETASL